MANPYEQPLFHWFNQYQINAKYLKTASFLVNAASSHVETTGTYMTIREVGVIGVIEAVLLGDEVWAPVVAPGLSRREGARPERRPRPSTTVPRGGA